MSMSLKYDMPGPAPDTVINGTGDSISPFLASAAILSDSAGLFTDKMVGQSVTISGATNPGNNGTFLITGIIGPDQIIFVNSSAVTESSSFSWEVTIPSYEPTGSCILAYDAAEVDDDEIMFSGPHTGTGGSTPPGSWPNPGPDDDWEGPFGPELVDWTNTSHPGADMTQGGWSPPNQSLKYDTDIPAGWYTRVSRRDRRSRGTKEVPTLNDPVI